MVEVVIEGERYTTSQVVLSNNSDIEIENPQSRMMQSQRVQLYPHIYLLIDDPTPVRFNYRTLSINGATRAMNVTPFIGLESQQLIALQVSNSGCFDLGEIYLAELKKQGLIDIQATLVDQESITYKQVLLNRTLLHPLGDRVRQFVEFIDTSHICNISLHIDRWKRVLKPWSAYAE